MGDINVWSVFGLLAFLVGNVVLVIVLLRRNGQLEDEINDMCIELDRLRVDEAWWRSEAKRINDERVQEAEDNFAMLKAMLGTETSRGIEIPIDGEGIELPLSDGPTTDLEDFEF
jgi:hypothetical protein